MLRVSGFIASLVLSRLWFYRVSICFASLVLSRLYMLRVETSHRREASIDAIKPETRGIASKHRTEAQTRGFDRRDKTRDARHRVSTYNELDKIDNGKPI